MDISNDVQNNAIKQQKTINMKADEIIISEAIKVFNDNGVFIATAVNFPMVLVQANGLSEMDSKVRGQIVSIRDMLNDIIDGNIPIKYYETDTLYRDLNVFVDKNILTTTKTQQI